MCHALAVPLEVISVEVIPGQAAVNKKYFLLQRTIRERVNHITVSALF